MYRPPAPFISIRSLSLQITRFVDFNGIKIADTNSYIFTNTFSQNMTNTRDQSLFLVFILLQTASFHNSFSSFSLFYNISVSAKSISI